MLCRLVAGKTRARAPFTRSLLVTLFPSLSIQLFMIGGFRRLAHNTCTLAHTYCTAHNANQFPLSSALNVKFKIKRVSLAHQLLPCVRARWIQVHHLNQLAGVAGFQLQLVGWLAGCSQAALCERCATFARPPVRLCARVCGPSARARACSEWPGTSFVASFCHSLTREIGLIKPERGCH